MKASFDEMNAPAGVRTHYRAYRAWLDEQQGASMNARREEAEMVFRRVGITFAVYGTKDEDGAGTERLIPFDVIPRIIPRTEWQQLEAGLTQRVHALNRFVHDVYHGQEILKAKKGFGLNAATNEIVDLVEAGVIDPAMVTRSALQNAASIAKNILTTEAIVAEIPEKEGAGMGGGMPDMGGMM